MKVKEVEVEVEDMNWNGNGISNGNGSRSILNPCSESLKKKDLKVKQRVKICYVPNFRILRKSCSKKKNKKKKKLNKPTKVCEEEKKESASASASVSSVPLRRSTMIIRRKTTITSTIITPFIQEETATAKGMNIYFCVRGNSFKDPLKWYKINPLKNTKGDVPTLSSICTMSTYSFPKEFTCIGLDSKLYAIGGYYLSEEEKNQKRVPTSKTFVCDVNSSSPHHPHPIWEECCSMNSPNINTALAVVDGLIYAIGSEKPCAEVFNPSLNQWTPLHSPDGNKHKTPDVDKSVFFKDRDEIMILSSSGGVYRFNVRSCSWTSSPNPFRKATWSNARSVAMGDVVLTFHRGQLYACDLSHPKPIEEPVYGLEKFTESIPPDSHAFIGELFYIGNAKLCLIWDMPSAYKDGMVIMTCVKFWVGKRNGKGYLQAVVDRTDYYLAEGGNVVSCLAMISKSDECLYLVFARRGKCVAQPD